MLIWKLFFITNSLVLKLNNIKNDLPVLKDFICINDGSDSDDVIEGSYDFEALIQMKIILG